MHTNLLCDNYLSFGRNIQHGMELGRCVYEVLQILGISLNDETHFSALFDKSKFENVKDQYDSSEPNLFSFYPYHL